MDGGVPQKGMFGFRKLEAITEGVRNLPINVDKGEHSGGRHPKPRLGAEANHPRFCNR